MKNLRYNIEKKQLLKWKKKKKEEVINIKKEQKLAQKDIKKKFKQELKNEKIKVEERTSSISRKKRMKNEIIVLWLVLVVLTVRIAWLQFGMGAELQSKAYVQQTLDRSINPRRGTIYDATVRLWLNYYNITSGVNIDEDTKRYYPYNNLASQIIGFSGSDNQGLDGIEAIYDEELKGTKGKIQKLTDATGGDIQNTGENYVEAIDGNDLVLTIDATIQGIAEKYLKEVCIDNKCVDGGNIVVMNPKNGDVLAIAGYPNYNLNEPFEPSTDELKEAWPSMSQADRRYL